jgi:hypothetical protein
MRMLGQRRVVDRVAGHRLALGAHALVFGDDVAHHARAVRVLRRVQDLRVLLGNVACPDARQVLRGVADRVRDETAQAGERPVQAEFGRRAADRADERSHVGVGELHVELVAAAEDVHRQQSRGVRDLLREVDRKVA